MRLLITVIFFFFTISPVLAKWQLVLNENFDNFDTKLWNTKLESGKKHYKNSDCFYRKKNVYVENGNLILQTQKDSFKKSGLFGRKFDYSCGVVNSFRKFKQKYGYFEARMKFPQAKGLWLAFWMMPDRSLSQGQEFLNGMRSTKNILESSDFVTGKGMELDVMEYLTEWQGDKYHTAAHWDGYSKDLKSFKKFFNSPAKIDEGFHTYGLYWGEKLLVWYFDGNEVARLQSDRVADVPMYLILSSNMGGWATKDVDKELLPEKTVIDFVRVWREVKD